MATLQRDQDRRTHLVFLNTKAAPLVKVPVSRRLRQALARLPKNGPAYFPSFHDTDPHKVRNRVIRRFTNLCEQADIPFGRKEGRISFHCLRHTAASGCSRAAWT